MENFLDLIEREKQQQEAAEAALLIYAAPRVIHASKMQLEKYKNLKPGQKKYPRKKQNGYF
jgi:hypothetical protein